MTFSNELLHKPVNRNTVIGRIRPAKLVDERDIGLNSDRLSTSNAFIRCGDLGDHESDLSSSSIVLWLCWGDK
jgi:hypothetical protein